MTSESKETSEAFDNALGGKFPLAESKEFWSALAAGHYDFETLGWVKLVAARVLVADAQPAAKRAGEMLRAVGLSGNDKHAKLRALVQALQDPPGTKPENGLGFTPADVIAAVRAAGLVDDLASDNTVRQTIRRALDKR